MDLLPTFLLIVAVLLITMGLTALLNVVASSGSPTEPLRHAPKLAPLISAIGMSFILQNVGLLWKGPSSLGLPGRHPEHQRPDRACSGWTPRPRVHLQADLRGDHHDPAAVRPDAGSSNRTRQGKAMRATAQDPDTAGLMGINVDRTIAITFVIAGALAGAAGLVQILYNNTTVWNLGFRFGLNSFTSAVLGGIGNLQGAVLGGLILGLINAFSDRYLSAAWTNAIVFGVLIAILVFRPTGLLGQKLPDRA